MSGQTHLILHTTVGNEADAQTLARLAVEHHLAACVHIEAIQSVYRWQGQLQQDPEWRLAFKTTPHRLPDLLAQLKAAHPYELPAFYTVPAIPATPEWGAWVEGECG